MLFPHDARLPDALKGADYFTTLSAGDGGDKTFWHHRELIRYKYGKTKKLDDALDFIESKYKELHTLLNPCKRISNDLLPYVVGNCVSFILG